MLVIFLTGFGSQYSTGLLRFLLLVSGVSTPQDFSVLTGFGSQYSTGLLRLLWVRESVLHWTSPFTLGSGVSTPQDFSVFSFCSPVFTMASEWKFNFRLFGPNV